MHLSAVWSRFSSRLHEGVGPIEAAIRWTQLWLQSSFRSPRDRAGSGVGLPGVGRVFAVVVVEGFVHFASDPQTVEEDAEFASNGDTRLGS